MENQPIFIAFFVAWLIFIPLMYLVGHRLGQSLLLITLSHIVPTVALVLMVLIFRIGDGVTTVQYAAGSQLSLALLKLWAGLWPILLFTTLGSSFALFIAVVNAFIKRMPRASVAATLPGLLLSILAFLSVGQNFPDA